MNNQHLKQQSPESFDRKVTHHVLSEFGQRESWPIPHYKKPEVTGIVIDSAQIPEELAKHENHIAELALMADVIRNLQSKQGDFALPELAAKIAEKAGNHIIDICQSHHIVYHSQRHISAEDPLKWISSNVNDHLTSLPSGRYFLHWGPLGTWRKKSPRFLHSFLLASFNDEVGLDVDRFNESCDNLFDEHFAEIFGDINIAHATPPYFYCANSIARGGEAAVAPYHFAYFFPEDHGLPIGEENTVIFFVDSYRARFERVSLALGAKYINARRNYSSDPKLFRGQVLWLRSHDISHGIKTLATDWQRIEEEFGAGLVSVIGEVLADIFGLLFLYRKDILDDHSIDRTSVTYSFIAELLNYLRRDPDLFYDSSAAYLEASFFLHSGGLRLSSDLKIDWDDDTFQNSVLSLAWELYHAVLNTNIPKIKSILDAHSYEKRTSSNKLKIDHLVSSIKGTSINV